MINLLVNTKYELRFCNFLLKLHSRYTSAQLLALLPDAAREMDESNLFETIKTALNI